MVNIALTNSGQESFCLSGYVENQPSTNTNMTKYLLAAGLLLAAGAASAQVTTFVLQPPELEGPLEFSWAQNWGLTPDLNDPANTITGFTAVVRDGTAADSLGCEAIVNTAAIAGKIALVYRGVCEFGLKSLNAQNAGAIGVVIVNNQGAPIAMGGGAVGDQVEIPVVMISTDGGALIRPEVDAGNVELLIGSVFGLYPYNLAVNKQTALIPQFSALPKELATNSNEFSVTMGTWVKNFGSEAQSNVTVTGRITQNGNEVYNNTSTAISIASGDSAFVGLPLFSQNGYLGFYEATYTINSPFMDQDGFPGDDAFSFNFLVDDLFAYAPVNGTTRRPISGEHYRAGGTNPNFQSCVAFRNANASRVRVEGMYGSAAKGGGASIDGEVIEARLIEWNDNFTTIANATFNNLVTIDVADYFYTEDLNQEMIYIPFNAPYTLENNKRYLFCLFTPATDVFLGYNTAIDHSRNETTFNQPMFPANDNGQWFAGGFGSDIVSANGVRMVSSVVGIDDQDRVEITPYPNPANEIIRIPVGDLTGKATLEIFNTAGAKVAERQVSVGGDQVLTVNVNDIPAGTYLFNMNFENGKRSSFRVVVTK
jgi:hypothetical protein